MGNSSIALHQVRIRRNHNSTFPLVNERHILHILVQHNVHLCSRFWIGKRDVSSCTMDHFESQRIEMFSTLVHSGPRGLVCSQHTIKHDDMNLSLIHI